MLVVIRTYDGPENRVSQMFTRHFWFSTTAVVVLMLCSPVIFMFVERAFVYYYYLTGDHIKLGPTVDTKT